MIISPDREWLRNLKELKQTAKESLSYLSLLNCEIKYKEREEETRKRLRSCAFKLDTKFKKGKELRKLFVKSQCILITLIIPGYRLTFPVLQSMLPMSHIHVNLSFSMLFYFLLENLKISLFNFCSFFFRETINYLEIIIHFTSSFDKVCI